MSYTVFGWSEFKEDGKHKEENRVEKKGQFSRSMKNKLRQICLILCLVGVNLGRMENIKRKIG